MFDKLQPVILAGGSGTRLWPLSRDSFPKQFIKFNSSSDLSFLQKTQLRLNGVDNIDNPIIICNEQHRFIVAEQMREINTKTNAIILEPYGRNTAPAIAVAALEASQKNQNSTLIILSSDHEIKKINPFLKAIKQGIKEANQDKLITFGVPPTYPNTGYGYIQSSLKIKKKSYESLPIKKFIEKPNLKKAEQLIRDKSFFWNSGIFLFKAAAILNELNKFEPHLLSLCREAHKESTLDLDFLRLNKASYQKCPNISIDIAVLERTKKGNVISLDVDWDDVGSWGSLSNLENKDKNGNNIIGDVITNNVKDCYLNSSNKLLVGIGIKDLIVVQTNDATLITNKDESQRVKDIVAELNSKGRPEGKTHTKVYRPWGYFNTIEEGKNWKVKQILVNSKSSLSLQKHKYRSEHWIIIKGIATVELDGFKKILSENQSTFIPPGTKHRLSNEEKEPLILIEVQCGKYLGEDDILRFKDDYGRIN